MDNILSIASSGDAALIVASKAKDMRLAENLSRKTLAARAGVSEASLKRFETTGEISFVSLLRVASALRCIGDFQGVFNPKPKKTMDEITRSRKVRMRGAL
jgi:transcriptional regulator with XRE-family HTH domain